ncbi:MAG: DUF2079 domain-containing protein, partial [Streptosporangiaceae bacterium]|nr:DUF2079 domain-containing protein [Streptosporangiaceae bacterium]
MLEERRPDTGAVRDGRVQKEVAVPRASPSPPSAYRDWVVWGTVIAVFGTYLTISLSRLVQLNPSSWDLGIFTEYVKQYASLRAPIVDVRGAGFNLLGDHFQVIVALIAPFFRVFPTPATLLVAQALLTAVSVFPVSQAAGEKLGTGAGRAIGAAYGFSWGLQQMADFDFHEIAFAVPLLAFSLSAMVRGRIRAAVWWALPLVFVKEDQGFTIAAMGLVLIYSGWRERDRYEAAVRTRAALFLVAWGLAWSLLAITVIIPHFNADHHYLYCSVGGVMAP